MISILFDFFLDLYTFIFSTVLGIFNFESETLTSIITYPVKMLISLKKIMPETIGALQSLVDIWLILFFTWGMIYLFIKIIQIFTPGKLID